MQRHEVLQGNVAFQEREVPGHDFSRAALDTKWTWALAPAHGSVQQHAVILSDRSPQDGGSRRICGCFSAEGILAAAAERKATIE
jgi:hypothetical protein